LAITETASTMPTWGKTLGECLFIQLLITDA
jgi:hypothetical protein